MLKLNFLYLIIVLICSIASVSFAGELRGRTICICDDGAEWPPFTYYERKNGQKTKNIVGFSVDVIDIIFKEKGIKYTISLPPWKRCMNGVFYGDEFQMFLSGGRNSEREKKYYISDWYYKMHLYYLFSNRYHKNGLEINTIEDLKNYKLCGILGYNYKVYGFTRDDIDTGSKNYDTLIRKLHTGRCDVSVDRIEILAGFAPLGKDYLSNVNLGYKPVPKEKPEPFHMMFTKNKRGKELKKIVDDGIKKLKRSGELNDLLIKYNLPAMDKF